MTRVLVSESSQPVVADATPASIEVGAPILPAAFLWRAGVVTVERVLETWKQPGPCTHGSGERYLRKHCYKLRMTDGAVTTVTFERKARTASQRKARGWLFAVEG